MAKRDQLTKAGPVYGNKRSKALNTSKRRWDLNLQSTKIKLANGKTAKVKISARTKRTLIKQNKLI